MIRNYEQIQNYLRYPTYENMRDFLNSGAFTKKKLADRYMARTSFKDSYIMILWFGFCALLFIILLLL